MSKQGQVTFWALIGVFVTVIAVCLIPVARELILGAAFMLGSGTAFLLFGVALIFFTLKDKVRGWLKKFMLITGVAAVGIPVSVILHNAIYGFFIHFLGEHFWERNGMSDEPVFFVLAIIVFPIAFLIGAIGNIILLFRR